MKRLSPLFVLLALVLAAGPVPAPAFEADALEGRQARIEHVESGNKISLWILQPGRYMEKDPEFFVSVEVPNKTDEKYVTASIVPFVAPGNLRTEKTAEITAAERMPDSVKALGATMPPCPDEASKWVTFRLSKPSPQILGNSPLSVMLMIPGQPLDFTRVLLGKPSAIRSDLIGAFAPGSQLKEGQPIIEPGEDYLGTDFALQRFRIPAKALAPDAEAFDEVVEFGDMPLDAKNLSNCDTVMIRTARISVGGTTPVRLVNFANRTKKPITVKGRQRNYEYEIVSTLSPNAVSSGFITVLPDGSYRSSTVLYPKISFQQIENGRPVGEPIVIDSALTQVPGFPFYLASSGGKWTQKAPEKRFTTLKSSNFFHDNGAAGIFLNSNGVGIGVNGKCAKSAVIMAP